MQIFFLKLTIILALWNFRPMCDLPYPPILHIHLHGGLDAVRELTLLEIAVTSTLAS